MKVAAFAITLMLGGAAIAQTTTTTHTNHTGTTTDVSTQVGTAGVNTDADVNADTSMPNTGTSVTTQSNTNWNTGQSNSSMSTTTQSNTSWNTGQTTMASNMAGQVVQPSNANPERDARGIRVISDPAMAPAGYNGTAGTGMGGPATDMTSGAGMANDGSTPACSKTVTDNCIQTYERGRSPR